MTQPESATVPAAREWTWRDRPGREPLQREHATERGYQQHRYRHEPACGRCLHAHQLHNTGAKT